MFAQTVLPSCAAASDLPIVLYMRTYEAFVFDLYGTLADIHTDENQPSLWKRMAGFAASNGAAYAPGELRTAYGRAVRRAEAELASRQLAIPGACPEVELGDVFRALYAAKGVVADAALVTETALLFRRTSVTHLRLYAGAAELLEALRKRGRVFLLTNAQRLFTRPELDALGLTLIFDRIYISSEAGFKKPDPRFFRLLLDQEGLDPARCLMIGNDPHCDGDGARAAGMDAWIIRSALSPRGAAGYDQEGMDLRKLHRMLCK